jgi:hypothetical protein
MKIVALRFRNWALPLISLVSAACSTSNASGPSIAADAAVDATGQDSSSEATTDAAPDALALGPLVEAGSPGQVDITFTVRADQNVHPISPRIYGTNNGNQAAAHRATIVRNGGNRMTAYNWENNASNAGDDYHFQSDDYLCSTMGGATNSYPCSPDSDSPGAYLKALIDQAAAANASMLLTVSMVDYVAADKNGGGDVRLFPDGGADPNYLQDRFKMNDVKGGNYQFPPDTTDGTVYQDEMVHWVAQLDQGTVTDFDLDNEPDLWSQTHAEVHPLPITYAELAQRNIKFATAVKVAMPSARVWGPVNYGWNGFVNLQKATDSTADGDFLTWWLRQMQAAAADAGGSVVDGMDLHWYSEVGDNGSSTAPGDDCRINSDPTTDTSMAADCYTAQGQAEMAAAREQAPRSLWDTTYVENSWIASSIGNKAIELIPRTQAKIAAYAPTMKLGFSEWNYGGGSDISGTIATADTLGIFGAYGVEMSMFWEVWHDESFTYAAYDVYRNYDGNGAGFGDTSMGASTSDVPNSSVYASLMASDPSHVVIVAINKALADKVAGIQIYHPTAFTTANVFVVTQAGGATVTATSAPVTAVATNAFAYTMPAQSVSVIVPQP